MQNDKKSKSKIIRSWHHLEKNKGCILVAGGRDPFGQHPESQPLAEFDFLSMRRVFAENPITFVRFDGKTEN